LNQLNEKQLLAMIASGKPFEAQLEDESLILSVKEYRPAVCTAIHDGGRMPAPLEAKCLLSKEERRQEEDPFTLEFISDCPVVIAGGDSRYAYDLNRGNDEIIYKEAWGKQVWKEPLTAEERLISTERYYRYYRILSALISKTIEVAGGAFVLDMHSYCYQIRQYDFAPVFNTGLEQLDLPRWEALARHFEIQLEQLEIPGVETTVARNEVFYGRAEQARFINENFPTVPVLPTEVKKVYMDEISGESYPDRIDAIREGITKAIASSEALFSEFLNI